MAESPDPLSVGDERSVAIVGMACRLPGSPDVARYWQNLRDGRELIRFFAPDELHPDAKPLAGLANFVPAAAVVADIDRFDAEFFRMSPREAAFADPQHRLFLEATYAALEDAAHGDLSRVGGDVGVYGGSWMSSYAVQARGHCPTPGEEFQSLVGTGIDYLTTFVSYKLDLTGESVAVQTACSTSLVAVHVACQSLLTGQVDLAVAGGVSIDPRQQTGYLYQEGMIGSPDGHCRPFDARAQGTVRGYGLGVVVLKRLEDALADRDPIRAIIRGTATNNDGAGKIGFTAPSVGGQARVIATALEMAGVSGREIGYVEAHGTGTPLGDPIEIEALRQAFASTDREFCAVGSVKSNLGHLVEAAGVAGLIKTVLILEHGVIPPTLHFETPNPRCELSQTPFRVADRLLPLTTAGRRLAGVSSFGIGGTNAHVVLEGVAERLPAESGSVDPLAFVLSAGTPAALEARTEALRAWLEEHDRADLRDVARTLAAGRAAMRYRAAYVARSREELLEALAAGGTVDPGGRNAPSETVDGPPVDPRRAAENPGSLSALAARWVDGTPVDWPALVSDARFLPLPTYPFQSERHWLEPVPSRPGPGFVWWLRGTDGSPTETRERLLLMAADDLTSLRQRLRAVGSLSESCDLDELCRSINLGPQTGPYRAAVPFDDRNALQRTIPLVEAAIGRPRTAGRLVWVFCGTAGAHFGMGRELMALSVFRDAIDAVDAELRSLVDWSLTEELGGTAKASAMHRWDVVQPAVFAMQVGLAALWRSLGVEPEAVVGHSMGEVAAAFACGALSLRDAVAVVVARSRIIERSRGHGLTAFVALTTSDAAQLIDELRLDLSIAGSNDDAGTVIAGPVPEGERLLAELDARGVFASRLDFDWPAHTAFYDPFVSELRESLADVAPQREHVTFVSTVTGERCDGTALTAEYWARNLRAPVQFRDAMARLIAQGHYDFLELAPRAVLVHSMESLLAGRRQEGLAVSSLAGDAGPVRALLDSAGRMFRAGYPVRWLPPSDAPGTAHGTAPPPADPATSITNLVATRLGLPADRIQPDEPLVDLGLDSVAALSLLAAINDHFGSALTPTDLVAAGTVTRITERLGHGRRASSPVVVPVRIAPEAHIRVALVPGAGGDALMMAPWAASGILGQHDVVAITPPGHGSDTQEPLADLDRSAELYADSLPSDDRPLIVVGFSLGCLVAFEVARRLELDGRPAIALVLVHGAAPDAWTDFPLRSDGPSFVDAFTAVYESYADMPQSKDAFLAAARADFAAAEGYDPSGRRVDCPVHVIASSDDSLVTTPPTAWRSFASHLHVHESVGEHFEFLTHEANRELLRRVCASSIAGQAPVTTPD